MSVALAAAGITAGASIYSANKSNKAQNSASAANDRLSQQQFDEDKRRWDLNREDQERWGMMDVNGQERMYQETQARNRGMMDRGEAAGNQLAYRMGLGGEGTGEAGGLNKRYKDFNFEAEPGYQFRKSEGGQGVNNSFAASGNLLSGAAMKALTRFNQDYASNEYGNAYGRYSNDRAAYSADNTNEYNKLMGLQGVGQNAVNSVSGAGTSSQNQISNAYSGIASALGNGTAQQSRSASNYYDNIMSGNNARANAQSAYNTAFGNSLGGGLGSAVGAWNSYQKGNNNNSYPTQNFGGYDYLDF
jgi:hypothetical protein